MAIHQVGSPTLVDGGGSTATISLTRLGVQSNSLLVMSVQSGGPLSGTPSGWSLAGTAINSDSAIYQTAVFYQFVATGQDVSVTVTRPTAGTLLAEISEWAGLGTSVTLGPVTTQTNNTTGAASAFPSTGTLPAATCLAIASFYNAAASGDTITGPSGWTTIATSSSPEEWLISGLVTTTNAALAPFWTLGVNAENANVLVTFAPSWSPPSITTQPAIQRTTIGFGPVTFSVSATGTGTLHYQWNVNGANVGTDSSTLSYTPGTGERISNVFVTVTDDNASAVSTVTQLLAFKAPPKPVRKHPLYSVDNSGISLFPKSLFLNAMFDPSQIALPSGSSSINASLNVTEAADSINSGSTQGAINASASITETADSISATTGVLVQTTASLTEAADTISASTGAGAVNASLSITEAADTISASASAPIIATVSVTEANDSLTATTAILVSTTLTITEGSDTGSLASGVIVGASVSATEGNDSVSSGSTALITATLSSTEAGDTLVGQAGAPTDGASLIVTEAPDTGSSTGSVAVTASVNVTEGADTGSLATSVLVQASTAVVEAPDSLAGASVVLVTANTSVVEAGDTLSANVSGPGVQASLSVTEGPDTGSSSTSVAVQTVLTVIEAPDSLVTSTTVVVATSGNIQEDSDTESASVSVSITANAVVIEGSDTSSGNSEVIVMASLNVVEHSDSISSFVQTVVDQGLIYIDPGLQPYTNGDLIYTDRSLVFGT